ncbi:MAG: orotate phosphoribosyltransferase, partial [Gammaproteobacteria bacterium]|nr:orotate phosphoribosyltransferase [Gammaproteobacteria bacterium]
MDTAIITSLYQMGAIQFGEFQLKSGQTSSIYLNLRKIISYPELLRHVSNAMWNAVQACQFDLVCGVPYTALPIATCISLTHHIPMIMRSKEKK